MIIRSIITFIIGVITIILGIFILKKNSKSPSNIFYFLLCLSGGSWSVVKSFQISVLDVNLHNIIITRLIYLFGSMAPFAYLLFAYNFPYKLRTYSKKVVYLIFSIPIIFNLLVLSGVLKMENTFIVNNLVDRDIRFFDFLIFALYFFAYIVISVVLLTKKYLNEQGVYKSQIKFIIIATATTYLTCGVVSVIFLLFNNVKYDWLGSIFLLIHFSITWYYIFYKPLEIKA